MNRREFIQSIALGSLIPCAAARASEPAPNRKPNIVLILCDDLGYGDIHAFNPGSRIPTPNLDRLANEGMRFTDAHSGSAVCTPTRYGVVTGRYSWRTRLKSGVFSGYSPSLIDPDLPTAASVLKKGGYHTACIGKWHLGMDLPYIIDGKKLPPNPEFQNREAKGGMFDKGTATLDYDGKIENGPQANGFDYNYNVLASLDMPPYVYVENDRFDGAAAGHADARSFPPFIRSGPIAPNFSVDNCLEDLTDKAVSYISDRAQFSQEKPFFLYLPLTAPHKPVIPSDEFEGESQLGPYGDFVMQVDHAIGQVEAALDREGIADNTLFVVTSDNGSFMYRYDNLSENAKRAHANDHVTDPTTQAYKREHHQANYHWRGTKADIHDGGHRVPFIARWPDRIQAGSNCDTPICLTDLLATFVDAAKIEQPKNAGEDSYSMLALMMGGERDDPRPPIVHHSANGTFALRDGPWKLIYGMGSGGRGAPRSEPWSTPYQLYNLAGDPQETKNRTDDPACSEIIERLNSWAGRLGVLEEAKSNQTS